MFDGQLMERTRLGLAIENFGLLGLKLDFAVGERPPLFALLVAGVEGDEVDMAVENVDALAAPKNDLDRVPVAEDLLDIERRRDAVGSHGGDALAAFFPNDVF